MKFFNNEKKLEKILNLNKSTLSYLVRLVMVICAIKIIYSFTTNIEALRPAIVLVTLIGIDIQINKCTSFDHFDMVLLLVIGIIQFSFILTMLIPFFIDNVISPVASIKSFYKIGLLHVLLINGKFNLESKGIKRLYTSYLVSMFIITVLLLAKYPLSYVIDEVLIFLLIIFISGINLNASLIYFDIFRKLLIKNKINIDKYENILDNLKSSFISINLTNLDISHNRSFKAIVESIDSLKCYEGFYENDVDSLEVFFKNDYNSDNFKKFLESNKLKQLYKEKYIRNISDKKSLKVVKFFKQIYYLINILEYLKDKDNEIIKINSIFTSEVFKNGQNFSSLGNYILENKMAKENQYFEVLFRNSVISDIEHIDIMINDNTQIILIEEERADTKYRKSYLSNVAHEFKAPIQILLITVNELSKLNFPKEAEELFRDIENLGNFILILIMDIISFSQQKMIEVKYDRFDSRSPFFFAIQVLQLLIKNNHNKCFSITSELVIDDNLPVLFNSDENRIKQVLVNLITNAYKFTMSGKIVIRVTLNASNSIYDEILVNVEDTGIGIKPEDKDKLFKQSIKLNDSEVNRDGTGLGLSICKNIIDRIGIKIGYVNRETTGSIFFFSFLSFKNDNICQQIELGQILKLSSYINNLPNIRSSSYKIFDCDNSKEEEDFNLGKVPQIRPRSNLAMLPTTILEKNKSINSSVTHNKFAEKILGCKHETKDFNYQKYKTNCSIVHLENEKMNVITYKQVSYDEISNAKLFKSSLKYDQNFSDINAIPDEVYDFYKITDKDSIYYSSSSKSLPKVLLCPDCPECKRAKMFYELFELVNKNSKHEDFGKIYHNFKPYIKFLIQSLRNIDNKVINTCIVDDNSMVLRSLKKMIIGISQDKKETYEVIKAYDGIEALALFKIDYYLNKSFKYVISDQNMTMMNGLETLAIIKKCLRNENYLKLFVSTSDDAHLKEKKIDYLKFLTKPVSKKELGKLYV